MKCGPPAERLWGDSKRSYIDACIAVWQERQRGRLADTLDHAGHDQHCSALDSSGHRGCGVGWSLLRLTTARDCFRDLFPDHALNHSLVATNLEQPHQHRLRTPGERAMKRIIKGFEKDDEDHWRAILDCDHRQHVRHDPPLVTRTWVLTPEGRDSRLGMELDCKRCDEELDAPGDN